MVIEELPSDIDSEHSRFLHEDGGTTETYDAIRQRFGAVRHRIVRELWTRGGEASVTILKDDDGANVKKNSLDAHLNWLRGENKHGDPLEWWPTDAPVLAEEVRREDQGYGNKTRIIGLTKHGEEFARILLAEESPDLDSTLENLRISARSNTDRLNTLTQTVNTLQEDMREATNEQDSATDPERVTELRDTLDDVQSELRTVKGRMDDIEATVERHDERLNEHREILGRILDGIENMQEGPTR